MRSTYKRETFSIGERRRQRRPEDFREFGQTVVVAFNGSDPWPVREVEREGDLFSMARVTSTLTALR